MKSMMNNKKILGYVLSSIFVLGLVAMPAATFADFGYGGNHKSSIVINNGDDTTTSSDVNLSLEISRGMTQMRISNDRNFRSGTGWVRFQSDYRWTLDSGLGDKTVYAQFRNPGNRHAAIEADQDSITVITVIRKPVFFDRFNNFFGFFRNFGNFFRRG